MADVILTREDEVKKVLDRLPEMVQDDLLARRKTRGAVYVDERTHRASTCGYLNALVSADLINDYERWEILHWIMT